MLNAGLEPVLVGALDDNVRPVEVSQPMLAKLQEVLAHLDSRRVWHNMAMVVVHPNNIGFEQERDVIMRVTHELIEFWRVSSIQEL